MKIFITSLILAFALGCSKPAKVECPCPAGANECVVDCKCCCECKCENCCCKHNN